MNIFILDTDPIKAAQYLCDKHIVKMISESCQMLANCHSPNELFMEAPRTAENKIRKHSHENHPCSVWVKSNIDHKRWLIEHVKEMLNQYYLRYHKPNGFSMAAQFLHWVEKKTNGGDAQSACGFVEAIPLTATCRQHSLYNCFDIDTKYRLYYACDKIFAEWRLGEPDWHVELIKDPEVKKLRRERMKQI